MVLLPLIDLEGSQERSRQRLKRMIYRSEVGKLFAMFSI